jgi:hypothetical protein
MVKLSELDMTVDYLAEVEMASPDDLSRYVAGAATSEDHLAEIKESLIQAGRRSWKATKKLIKRRRSWPNMRQDIRPIVRSSPVWICFNILTTKIGKKLSLIQAVRPNEMLCVTTGVKLQHLEEVIKSVQKVLTTSGKP